MSGRLSAGLLLYRRSADHGIEIMAAHMGGPFWAKKDDGGWSIPKGEYDPEEDPLAAARREFAEETGLSAPEGPPLKLGEIRQPSRKVILAWAIEADIDVSKIRSNTFEMEWPKGSGRMQEFPEVDRAAWFDIPTARRKLVRGQLPFLDALLEQIGVDEASLARSAAQSQDGGQESLF